jgi:hypothetical protein
MIEIDVEELRKQVKLSEVQFLGGPRDGDTLIPLDFKVDHLVSTHSLWWTEKNSVHLYLLNKRDERYYLMYVGGKVDDLLKATSEVHGKVPWDLVQVVPLLKSMEKGCKYYEGS